jgi:hypothetical protein
MASRKCGVTRCYGSESTMHRLACDPAQATGPALPALGPEAVTRCLKRHASAIDDLRAEAEHLRIRVVVLGWIVVALVCWAVSR